MNDVPVKRLRINWGIVGVILIGVYLGLGWFARGYVDDYQAKQAETHQVQVGIGGGPPADNVYEVEDEGKDDVVDMLCLPMEGELEEKKVLQEI